MDYGKLLTSRKFRGIVEEQQLRGGECLSAPMIHSPHVECFKFLRQKSFFIHKKRKENDGIFAERRCAKEFFQILPMVENNFSFALGAD